ncbi:ABC transporter substrate-binding protein [Paenibacillus aceris]|uniref:ABC-type glycerol-3-phosphate transport system substrate-binding protein n=1 Tax=Paenibacillus aceris TaxID=869555 RepID=A0ABS4I6V6_9BACL|nr:extracellular solute-binding protein [Paenibacillus aceris]MBP1966647.1 ABC-type glycerol-3-phosphate transport system substrate-binding protein [Paenibacillus aceris]NHW38883.1 extracellular solute-binding protein [Paenibacillus aceris]
MVTWKRSQLLLLAGILLGTLLTSCLHTKDQAKDQLPKGESKVKLRIAWWGSQERHEATMSVLHLYTQKFPNITFEPEYSGLEGYLDKINTQALAKNPPDIVQLDAGWISDWASRQQLLPLEPSVNISKVDLKLMSSGQYKGMTYAVPLGSVAYGMIYDRSALEKLGMEAPKNGWTWDDFFIMAKESKNKLPQGVYFTKDFAGDYFAYSAFQFSRGKGKVMTDDGKFNIDERTFLTWTQTFEQMRKEGIVPPPEINLSDKEFDPNLDLMVAGKIIMRMSFSNNLGGWDSLKRGAYALVTMPRSQQAGGWLKPSMFFGVSSNSKYPEEAKRFIDWFINDPEAGAILKTVRGLPVNSDVAASIETYMSETDKAGLSMFHATLENGQAYSPGPNGWINYVDRDWPLVRDQLSFGKITPKEAFEQLRVAAQKYEN